MAQLNSNSGKPETTTAYGIEMEERKEPSFVQFEGEGDFAEGVLVSVAPIEVKSNDGKVNKTVRYTLKQYEGEERCAFLGNYQINTKLSRADVGKFVQVRYTGKQDTRAGEMKMFDIRVSKKPVADVAALLITDSDIPF